MAGNFWQSSHYQQWMLCTTDLLRERHEDLKLFSQEEYQKIIIFFANVIQAVGEHSKVRQQVIATATIYFKRFYARNSLHCVDPLLMAPTCILLASKVEEFGVLSSTRLIQTCQQVVKNKFSYAYTQDFPYRIQNVLECEFFLLEAMDCCLILFHPYRPLLQYIQDMSQDEALLQLAWRIINDSLRTDVSLLYPPYMIALAALNLACVMQQKDNKQWFADLSVDLDKVIEITKHILALYDLWKNYDEKKEIGALLNRIPKPKASPSRPPSQGPNGQEGGGTNQTGSGTQSQMSSQGCIA
jgi:cyclin C